MDTGESSEGEEGEEMESSLLQEPAREEENEADDPPHRMLKTVCLVLLWISYGLLMSVGMTTLVDFTEILHVNYSRLGMALAFRFLTHFCGLYLGGFLQDGLKWRHELLLSSFTIVISLANLIKPYCRHVIVFAALVGAEGIVQGMAGPAANNLLMLLWREKSPIPVSVFHFGWGIGSFLGPLLTKPFLSERCPSTSDNSTASSNPACEQYAGDNEIKYIRDSRIAIPFTLASMPILIMSGVFLLFYFRERRRNIETHTKTNTIYTSPEIRQGQPKLWRGIIVVLLACFYFFLTIGGPGGYLFTIAFESDLNISKNEASELSAAYNAAFTAGGFISFLFLQWISIKTIFIFYAVGTLASMIALVIFGLKSSSSLWLLSCLYGIYAGPLWPCGMSWTNHYIHLYTINISTAVSGASVGEILLFWLGGHLLDSGHISEIFVMTLSGTAFTCVVVVALYIIGYHIGERKFRKTDLSDIELDVLR